MEYVLHILLFLHLKGVLIVNDAGRIGFVIRDDYDNTVQYDFLDVVYYHGNSYVAKKLTLGNIPNENNEYWHILAAGGVRVKGDAETEYRNGDVNITKENIGLGNVENKSSETIRNEITSENITNALDYTPTNTKVKGNAESEYRTGEVNLTPENIGAVDEAEFEKRFAISGTIFNTVDDFPSIGSGFGVNTTILTLYDGFAIPSYSRICFMNYGASKDGILIAVGMNGKTYTANRLNGVWRLGKVLTADTDIMQGATSTAAGKAGLVPAPGAGNTNRALMSNGFFEETNSFMSSKISANIGWWTICEIGTDSNLLPNNILLMVAGYSGDGFSSFLVNISEVGYYNYANCKTLSIRTNPNGVVGISKIRKVTVSGKTLYQVYANVNCDFSIRVITSPRDITYYKTAVADGGEGSVIYEYTIPDKDDFDTSKSLTRFEQIPDGADLKSDKYLVPGNYCCFANVAAITMLNCPVNEAFTLTVEYACGSPYYIRQIFKPLYARKIVARTHKPDGWDSDHTYMSYEGTPPANKLWGTDANGNVGWQSIPNKAAAHNAIFRGENLTSKYTIDQICSRIANGTFDDLYIGDYFDITISTSYTSSETVRCILAGFNPYWNCGDNAFAKNHAVIVPKNCFTKAHAMNSSNTTVGAYVGSDMWTTVLPVYKTALQAKFGNHLLMHRTLLTKTINANLDSNAGAGFKGASTDWGWYDTYLSLLSEIQIYGSNVWSSSGYDTGCENLQLPLFALDPTAKVCALGGTGDGRHWYWLRNVASSTNFARCSSYGHSDCASASYSGGVRPLFCIG